MKFKIIPNQQTPAVIDYKEVNLLISEDFLLLTKFLSFARRQYNCAGLASNQVAVDGCRIMEPFFAIRNGNGWDLILHPRITQYYGKKQEKIEGCLTWLGKDVKAMRHPSIQVRYYNLKGEEKNQKISGYQAQIFQHECCHLLGIEEEIVDRENI